MLRVAALRCARSAVRVGAAPRPRMIVSPVQLIVRTKVDDAKRAALNRQDALQKDWDAPVLTYEQVKARTERPTTDAYLIDVREPDEVAQGSIPSSVNVPLSVIANSLHLNPEAFREKHGFEKPKVDQEVVFYCRSGRRSASAADVAKRNGYTNIFNYSGSWLDWVQREGSKPAA